MLDYKLILFCNFFQTDLLVPLSSEDLLTREKEQELKEAKSRKHSTEKDNPPIKALDRSTDVENQHDVDKVATRGFEGSIVTSNSEDDIDIPSSKRKQTIPIQIDHEENNVGGKSENKVLTIITGMNVSCPPVQNLNKRKLADIDTETDKEYNSEEELLDTGVDNTLRKFSFESDHLAIKNNKE